MKLTTITCDGCENQNFVEDKLGYVLPSLTIERIAGMDLCVYCRYLIIEIIKEKRKKV